MVSLINRFRVHLVLIAAVAITAAFIPAASFAADVDVYIDGSYTDTDLVVHVFADINAGPILSFGVRVDYPPSLVLSSATKNEAVWYFGDGTPEYSYMDPEEEGNGVVIIGGKLDTSAPTDGVAGSRVLLGTIKFTHSGVTDFCGVTLTYGRGDGTGDFKNFVGTDGTVYDGAGVGFSVGFHVTGDVTGDGWVNLTDLNLIRDNFMTSGDPGWIPADINCDGWVNLTDLNLIRDNFMTYGGYQCP